MLAALLTRGDRTWSFKISGPAEQVAEYAEPFRELLKSIRATDEDIAWDTPTGWLQRPASGMRMATLVPNAQDPTLECAVVVLPRQDNLANVNRWRGQMQLPSIQAAELPRQTATIAASAGEILLLDITGKLSADSMMPPFVAQQNRAPSPPTPPAAPGSPFQFSAPDHWTPQPKRMSQLEVFSVADGDRQAEISVATLGLAGGALEPNVNRWRGQLGLGPWSSDDVQQALTKRTVGGIDAQLVELAAEDNSRAMLGAILYRDDAAWFFKLSGDKKLVDQEKEAFQQFLDSIEFQPSSE